MSPAIVQEHNHFLIVDKPAGWLVHPTRPDGTFTLIDWLRDQYPDEFLSLVSRLDRETSGLLLVARGKENASLFGKCSSDAKFIKVISPWFTVGHPTQG